jgi:hypothetical protein
MLLSKVIFTFNSNQFIADCDKRFKLKPRYDFVFDYFGGRDIDRDFFKVSNIIFSQGDLDPWRVGGVYRPVTGWTSLSLVI